MPLRDIRVIKRGSIVYGFGVVRSETTEHNMKYRLGMKESDINKYFESVPYGYAKVVSISSSSSLPLGLSKTFLEQPITAFGDRLGELVVGVEFKTKTNLLLLDIGRAGEEKIKNFKRIIEEGLEEAQRTQKGVLKCFHGIMFYRNEGFGNYECILFHPHRVLEKVREVPFQKSTSPTVDPAVEVDLVIGSSVGYFRVETFGEKQGETFGLKIEDQELKLDVVE